MYFVDICVFESVIVNLTHLEASFIDLFRVAVTNASIDISQCFIFPRKYKEC